MNGQETGGGARARNDDHGVPGRVSSAPARRGGNSTASGSGNAAGVANAIWFAIDTSAQIAHGSFEG